MESVLSDVRYALRTLRSRPTFLAVAVLTLALGIGANTAVFSVVDGVLLRPLPYESPDRIAVVWNRWRGEEATWISEPEILDYRARASSFRAIAAYTFPDVNLTGDAEPERVRAAAVTGNLFDVLGTEAEVGRTFVEEEGAPGGPPVAVVGHGLWQRRYGGDPSIVGSDIRVDGTLRTVVGVMPAEFRLPLDYGSEGSSELWIPGIIDPADPGSRGSHSLYAVGRLADGATVDRASEELASVGRALTEEGYYHPEMEFSAFARSVEDEVLGSIRTALYVLLAAVGFLLLMACANVANLLLVRAEGRRKELALRTALGAGRGRVVRQLLTESVVLSLAGGLAGIALAYGGVRLLSLADPAQVPRVAEVGVDGRALLFAVALAAGTGLLFGLAPALRASRADVRGELAEGGRSDRGSGRSPLRGTLVVAEVALAVVLLVGAGLMLRTFQELQRIDPGFEPAGVLTARLTLPSADYPESDAVVRFYRELDEALAEAPGVEEAGLVRNLPLAATIGDWDIDIEGRAEGPGESFKGDWQVATPGYFEAMGIRLVRGRTLEDSDREDAPGVVVVNETLAEEYLAGEDPVGRRLRIGGAQSPWLTIVGVVGDVRHNGLTTEVPTKWYIPHAQAPASLGSAPAGMTVVARGSADPEALAGPLRSLVGRQDPNLPVAEVRTMAEVHASAVSEPRFTMLLLTIFAGMALFLATLGVYGVLAYSVRGRTREIGLRMALGAESGRVLRLILEEGAILAGTGLILGTGFALLGARAMRGLLYQVEPTDASTFVAVLTVLAAVSLAAVAVPATRATRVDPAEALRGE